MARYTPLMRCHGLSAMPNVFPCHHRARRGAVIATLLACCLSATVHAQNGAPTINGPIHALRGTELRELLSEPAARAYQQQIETLKARGRYDGELDALLDDPQLPLASKEWLLHELVLALRSQTATDAGWRLLQQVQKLPSQTLLWHDFEGRQRALPLVSLSRAALVTEQHWQIQQRIEKLNQTPTLHALQTAIAQWPQSSRVDQLAWQQTLRPHPTRWQPLLAQLDAAETLRNAPELAVAAAHVDTTFLATVLQHGDAAEASALLADWSARPSQADDWQWLSIALERPALRSQAWFGIGKRSSVIPAAAARIETAVAQGDRDATAAWVSVRGDSAVPALQKQLYRRELPAQQAAVLGLRLLGTPAAQAALRVAKMDTRLPASLRQELQP